MSVEAGGKKAVVQVPRGMRDILPGDVERWQAVETAVHELAAAYGYREIRTPVVEHTELFQRTSGETSDIVQKEMYTFIDRGGRSLSLRPEGTAPVMRANLEHGLQQRLPQPGKFYYIAPMFRYDRPQRGRYRQHTQFGAEIIGSPEPSADVEVLTLAVRLLQRVGLTEVTVYLNSVGDATCRPRYVEALRQYFEPYRADLCEDCQARLDRQPLRILECKKKRCQVVAMGAPLMLDYLCEPCATHLDGVKRHFDLVNVAWVMNPRIVRGMDYYTRTAVEVYSGRLGAQNAMFGGGRYDGLAEQIGGRRTPGVGFGLGLDRLLLVVEEEGLKLSVDRGIEVMVVTIGTAARDRGFQLADELRARGVRTEIDHLDRAVGAQVHHADRLGARVALILGDTELAVGEVTIRILSSGHERRVSHSLVEIISAIEPFIGKAV